MTLEKGATPNLIGPETTVNRNGKKISLPDYAQELSAFHRAFESELRELIAALPVDPHMQVIDVGCGDGFYTELFAERLVSPGSITGLDSNTRYLDLARNRLATRRVACNVDFIQNDLGYLSQIDSDFDMVWCAQSLFSLPDPVVALKHMASVLRPGGLLVVLENDTLHQLLLPWSSRLELVVREAELAALCDGTARPEKYYVGRHLPALFLESGLEPLGVRSQCIDRQAPFEKDLTAFLTAYLSRLARRVASYLDDMTSRELVNMIDPRNADSLLHQDFAAITWLNVLAWAGKGAMSVPKDQKVRLDGQVLHTHFEGPQDPQ